MLYTCLGRAVTCSRATRSPARLSSRHSVSATCSRNCERVASACTSWFFTSCAESGCSTARSEEHTSELQSQSNLVCRLLLEKKKKTIMYIRQDVSVLVVI